MVVVAQITKAVSTDNIGDNVGNKLNRIHLLTRKDIHNIEHSFKIRSIERHSECCIMDYRNAAKT